MRSVELSDQRLALLIPAFLIPSALFLCTPICGATPFQFSAFVQKATAESAPIAGEAPALSEKETESDKVTICFKVSKEDGITDMKCDHLDRLSKKDAAQIKKLIRLAPLLPSLPSRFPDEMEIQVRIKANPTDTSK